MKVGETLTYYLPSYYDDDPLDMLIEKIDFVGDFPPFVIETNRVLFLMPNL